MGRSCVLLNETLSPAQFLSCNRITGRAYGTFDRNINGVGFLTGANTLDVAAVGIDLALVTANTTLLTDAYRRIHLELVVRNTVKSDGIRADGSFGIYSNRCGHGFLECLSFNRTTWRDTLQRKLW